MKMVRMNYKKIFSLPKSRNCWLYPSAALHLLFYMIILDHPCTRFSQIAQSSLSHTLQIQMLCSAINGASFHMGLDSQLTLKFRLTTNFIMSRLANGLELHIKTVGHVENCIQTIIWIGLWLQLSNCDCHKTKCLAPLNTNFTYISHVSHLGLSCLTNYPSA